MVCRYLYEGNDEIVKSATSNLNFNFNFNFNFKKDVILNLEQGIKSVFKRMKKGKEIPYFINSSKATRLFFLRPALVSFVAIGSASP